MDSSAYLTRHGWRGSGHALHPGGIKKPLLVSKKTNVLGLGKKQNDAHADQWWARAFDSGLKNLQVSQDAKASAGAANTKGRGALELISQGGGRWTGLYASFTKGQGLDGTWNATASQVPAKHAVSGGDSEAIKPSTSKTRTIGGSYRGKTRKVIRGEEPSQVSSCNDASDYVESEHQASAIPSPKSARKEKRKRHQGDGRTSYQESKNLSSPEMKKTRRKKVRREHASGDHASTKSKT